MLNAIWAGMIVLGILYGAFTGNLEAVSNAALESAGEAVDLCITMCGIMGLWTGLMKIARIPKNHPARESISTNIVANVLGLGWAATPAGLKAMEDLAQLEEKRRQTGYLKNVPKDTASNEMCTFLILNISSLQLIPVIMIAYRSQYGSASPAAVVGPAVLATLVSTFAAVIFCRVMDRR